MGLKSSLLIVLLTCCLHESFGGMLAPNGAHVCKSFERRQVMVNASTIATRVDADRRHYTSGWWAMRKTKYRTVYRLTSTVQYRTVMVWKYVPVFYCCAGWTSSEDSYECKKPICGIECMNGGKCVAPDKCECPLGFEGQFCQNDMNECNDESKNNCEQLCENTRGGFQCHCRQGFITHQKQRNKCIDINECSSNPCKCQSGDKNCSATCINTNGGYECLCKPGYKLQYDTCIDINECIGDVCEHECINLPGSYQCSCLIGFDLNTITGQCIDIDECKIQNGGCNHECHNVEGGYTCSCNEGYFLGADRKTCEVMDASVKYSLTCADEPTNFAQLSCYWPAKIKIKYAFYGRVASDVCMYKNYTSGQKCSYTGITELVAKRCDGKASCFVGATDHDFPNIRDPCPNTSKYLVVIHKCILK